MLPKRREPLDTSPAHDFDRVAPPEAEPRLPAALEAGQPHRIVFVGRRSGHRPIVAAIATICSLG